MIRVNAIISEWANELLFYVFEWGQELSYGVYAGTKDYPEIHTALYKLIYEHNDWVEDYVTYNPKDLELVNATFGKEPTLTYSIPVELDDEALLRDYGDA